MILVHFSFFDFACALKRLWKARRARGKLAWMKHASFEGVSERNGRGNVCVRIRNQFSLGVEFSCTCSQVWRKWLNKVRVDTIAESFHSVEEKSARLFSFVWIYNQLFESKKRKNKNVEMQMVLKFIMRNGKT